MDERDFKAMNKNNDNLFNPKPAKIPKKIKEQTMMNHALEFAEWCCMNNYFFDRSLKFWFNLDDDTKLTKLQLYKKFLAQLN